MKKELFEFQYLMNKETTKEKFLLQEKLKMEHFESVKSYWWVHSLQIVKSNTSWIQKTSLFDLLFQVRMSELLFMELKRINFEKEIVYLLELNLFQ